MNLRKTTLILATALLICTAFLLSVTPARAVTDTAIDKGLAWQADDEPVSPPPDALEPPVPPAPDPVTEPDATPPSTADLAPELPVPPAPDPVTEPAAIPPSTVDLSPAASSENHTRHHPFPPGPSHPRPPVPSYPYYSDPYVWPYPYARWSPYVNTYTPEIVVEIPQPQPVYEPVISSFTANPSYIQPGQSTVLSWTVNNASDVTISPSVGSVPGTGVYTTTPAYTTTYTLTASGSGGSVSAGTTVTVAQYYSTYSTGSGVNTTTGSSGYTAGTGGILTSGVSSGGSPALNLWLLYALMIGLLAAAAAVIIFLLVRKPVPAYSGRNFGTRAGYIASSTAPAATLPAAGSHATTAVATAPAAKFTAGGGKEISLAAGGQSLGRNDFRALAGPGKADLISRQHIYLSYENGDYYIEDRGSTNGTRLNGTDIRGKGKHILKEGDNVDLAGALTITYKP